MYSQQLKINNLTGIWSPVYMGECLHKLVNEYGYYFGGRDPMEDEGRLMDYLHRVKEGWCLKNTLILLLYIYSKVNNLHSPINRKLIHSDSNMMEVFGGNIPAEMYLYRDNNNITRILMKDAVASGMIDEPMNTYDVATVMPGPPKAGPFNPYEFHVDHIQTIIAVNIYTKEFISHYPKNQEFTQDFVSEFNEPILLQDLIDEYYIVKDTFDRWNKIFFPFEP
jgi:hypothetical protein